MGEHLQFLIDNTNIDTNETNTYIVTNTSTNFFDVTITKPVTKANTSNVNKGSTKTKINSVIKAITHNNTVANAKIDCNTYTYNNTTIKVNTNTCIYINYIAKANTNTYTKYDILVFVADRKD